MTKVPERIKKELLEYPFVTAVGTGYGRGERHENGAKAAVAFVTEKKAESGLADDEMLPKRIDGWKVDVQEVGGVGIEPITPQSPKDTGTVNTTDRHRPNPQGVSIGHPDVTAGTAGFIAWEAVESHGVKYPAPRGVTNNHVAAAVNEADPGDSILQPGSYDGGNDTDQDRIGKLEDYVKIEDEENLVDVAYYSIDDRSSNSYIPSVGVPRETAEVRTGDIVKKFGRTTGLESGEVRSPDARIRVKFDDGLKEFTDQVICDSISSGGDSGSAVVTNDSRLAGLLFAGSSEITIFNKISNVLDETGLHLNPSEVY